MYPELFKIGAFTVYSYGVMFAAAFIAAVFFWMKEMKRKGFDIIIGVEMALLGLLFGIIGSKLLFLIENWERFIDEPFIMAFTPAGSSYYGGLILTIIVLAIYLKKKKIPFLIMADAGAPSLIISAGIGRLGCHLAGDGDYGIPTFLPWGVNYENGTMPPSAMFRNTEIAKSFPDGIVPNNTPLHPTPVYEFIAALIIFFILWRNRKSNWADGRLFMLYLILSAGSRFLVEFIRLNPRILFGFSEAQLIAIVLGTIGIVGFYRLNRKRSNVTIDSGSSSG